MLIECEANRTRGCLFDGPNLCVDNVSFLRALQRRVCAACAAGGTHAAPATLYQRGGRKSSSLEVGACGEPSVPLHGSRK